MSHPDDEPHLAHDVPEAHRLDYLTVVASLVAADQEVADAELVPLKALCDELALPDAARAAVLATARKPDAAAVEQCLRRVRKHVGLRVALLSDAIVIVFADGKVTPAESQEIARLGDALGIAPAQIELVARYVESVIMGDEDEADELAEQLGKGVAAAEHGARHPGAIRWLHRLFHRGSDEG
jgi:uncharacterized tellurite resistance protein B-like protein